MGLVYIDGLEDNSAVVASTGTVTYNVAARTAKGIQTAANAQFSIRFPTPYTDTVTVGFAFRPTSITGTNFSPAPLTLLGDTGTTAHIAMNLVGGNISVVRGSSSTPVIASTTTTPCPAANRWYYVEFQARMHDTLGTVIVRVDGVEVINASGLDTKNAGTATVFDTVQFGMGISGTTIFDDVYLMAGTGDAFLGDCTVATLLPNGNGFGSGGGGWGTQQRPTIASSPTSASSAGTGGASYTFAVAGRVVGVRYQTHAANTFKLQAWNTTTSTKITEVTDTPVAGGTYTVTFTTPVAVTAGQKVAFTYASAANNVPILLGGASVTNTTDVAFVEYCYNFTFDAYPNNVTPNACYVEPIFEAVTAGGAQFIGSDGNNVDNYLLVDEQPPSSTDYVSSATVGDRDLYTLTNLTGSGTILAVAPTIYAAKDEVGPRALKPVVRGSTSIAGAALPLDFAYATRQALLLVNPETGLAWTTAEVNALQAGVEVV